MSGALYPNCDLTKLSAVQVEEHFKNGWIDQAQVKKWCEISASGEYPRTYKPRYKTKPVRILENGIEVFEEFIHGVHLERVGD